MAHWAWMDWPVWVLTVEYGILKATRAAPRGGLIHENPGQLPVVEEPLAT